MTKVYTAVGTPATLFADMDGTWLAVHGYGVRTLDAKPHGPLKLVDMTLFPVQKRMLDAIEKRIARSRLH